MQRLDRRLTLLKPVQGLRFSDDAGFADGAGFLVSGSAPATDEYGGRLVAWYTVGTVWARRADISDGERQTTDQRQSSRMTRFTIRDSVTARTVGADWRVFCEGDLYHVAHAKEAINRGRGRYLEITAGTIDS